MKALLVSAATVGLIVATPAFATAGPTASANATADAVIVQPIAVYKTADLSFGRIAADSAASTVTVDNANNRTSSSPPVLVPGGTVSTASFDVKGESGLAYTASLASPTTSLTGPGPAMLVNLNLYAGTGTLSASAPSVGDTFKVGGVLNVGPSSTQTAGAYTGTFSVNVQYN